MELSPAESERRRLAAIDKLHGISPDTRAAIEALTNSARGHAAVMGAAEKVLDDLRRRMERLIARQALEAAAERERMARRLGRPFQGVAA